MRLFILLGVFYTAIVIFGVSTSHARGGACSNAQCTEQEIAAPSPLDEVELTSKLESLLETLQDKVSIEQLHGIIQTAAAKNAQVAELLKLVQGYGVLTEIKLDAPAPVDE